jgi:hypothetical protein
VILICTSIGLALLLCVLAWKTAVAQTLDVQTDAWDSETFEVVIDTFTALTQPSEDDYLLENLTLHQYVRCRRERAALARKCLKHIGRCASLVAAIETTPGVAEEPGSAQGNLRRAAVRVRFDVAVASVYFFLVWLFPKHLFLLKLQAASFREFLGLVCSERRTVDSGA